MSLLRSFVVLLVTALTAASQSGPRGRSGVTFGHIHLNSADPDAAAAFWTQVVGATTYSHEGLKGVSLLGAIILISSKAPSGPSAGSAIDHIGLKVPDAQPFAERAAKTGYKSSHPKDGADDRILIDGPDGVEIELIEDSAMYAPVEFNHVHFQGSQPGEMQAWYDSTFSAKPNAEEKNTSQLGGASLIFTHADSAAPTAGRAIDHIGFEVKGLEAFCKELTEKGVKLDLPYTEKPELKAAIAFLTDAWGTRIELTEGLSR